MEAMQKGLTKYNIGACNQTKKLILCNEIINDFYMNWSDGTRYLTTYLRNLQSLNCSQFHDQCSNPTLDFNPFTNLIYLKFCNQTRLKSKCFDEINSVLSKQSIIKLTDSWFEIVDKINFSSLNKMDLEKPCLQVAMYDQNQTSNQYVEIIEPFIPFCSIVWFGSNTEALDLHTTSLWSYMSHRYVLYIVFEKQKYDFISF